MVRRCAKHQANEENLKTVGTLLDLSAKLENVTSKQLLLVGFQVDMHLFSAGVGNLFTITGHMNCGLLLAGRI